MSVQNRSPFSCRSYLSNRVFFLLSGALFLAVIAMLSAPLKQGVGVLIVGLLFAIIYDFAERFNSDDIKVKLKLPNRIVLTNDIELEIFVFIPELTTKLDSEILFLAPSSEHFHWEHKSVLLKLSECSEGLAFHGTLKGTPHTLGASTLTEAHFLCSSVLKLWLRAFQGPIGHVSYRVMPVVRPIPDIELTRLLRSNAALSQSRKVSLRNQSEDEFRSVRPYQFPDSLRRLDRKKSAKYQKLMTRTYESHRNHHLIIALDLGRGMAGEINGSKKLDYYTSLMFSLVEYALKAGDRVSAVAFSDQIDWMTKGVRDSKAFQPVYQNKVALTVRDTNSRYEFLPTFVNQLDTKRSLVLLLSDLSSSSMQKSVRRILPSIARKHLFLTLTMEEGRYSLDHELGENDSSLISDEGIERFLYLYWSEEEYDQFSRLLGRYGASGAKIPEPYWLDGSTKLYRLLRSSLAA